MNTLYAVVRYGQLSAYNNILYANNANNTRSTLQSDTFSLTLQKPPMLDVHEMFTTWDLDTLCSITYHTGYRTVKTVP